MREGQGPILKQGANTAAQMSICMHYEHGETKKTVFHAAWRWMRYVPSKRRKLETVIVTSKNKSWCLQANVDNELYVNVTLQNYQIWGNCNALTLSSTAQYDWEVLKVCPVRSGTIYIPTKLCESGTSGWCDHNRYDLPFILNSAKTSGHSMNCYV